MESPDQINTITTPLARARESSVTEISPNQATSRNASERHSENMHTETWHFHQTLREHGLTEADLEGVLANFIRLAKRAGEVMKMAESNLCKPTAKTKNNTSDIVTKFDMDIQRMVQEELEGRYPNYDFLGEETFKADTVLSDKPTFVVDPIDGTLNFSRGVPNCAISLGFTLEKKPIVGVVYNPFRGDLFTAVKGKGAFWTKMFESQDKIRLPVHTPEEMSSLNDCLVIVEWGNERKGKNWALRTDVHKKLMTSREEGGAMCKSIRSNGSCALDFCYVATGMMDVYWEGGTWAWDVCGGWIILEEAGGIVASANPGDWNPTLEGRLYCAVRKAEPHEQKAVVEELWKIMGRRRFKWKPGTPSAQPPSLLRRLCLS